MYSSEQPTLVWTNSAQMMQPYIFHLYIILIDYNSLITVVKLGYSRVKVNN